MSQAPCLWSASQSKLVLKDIRRINVIRSADLNQDSANRLSELLQTEISLAKAAISAKRNCNAEVVSSHPVSRLLRMESEKLRKIEEHIILLKSDLQMIDNSANDDLVLGSDAPEVTTHSFANNDHTHSHNSARKKRKEHLSISQKEKLATFFHKVNWISVDLLDDHLRSELEALCEEVGRNLDFVKRWRTRNKLKSRQEMCSNPQSPPGVLVSGTGLSRITIATPVAQVAPLPIGSQVMPVANGNHVMQQTAVSMHQSVGRMQQPAVSMQQHAFRMQQPPVIMQQPPVIMQQPPVRIQQPPVRIQQPSVRMQQPPVRMQQPAVRMQQPPANMQHSSLSMQQSAVCIQQSAGSIQQQAISTQQPVDWMHQLAIRIQQPVGRMRQHAIGFSVPNLNSFDQTMQTAQDIPRTITNP
eukprot:748170_1